MAVFVLKNNVFDEKNVTRERKSNEVRTESERCVSIMVLEQDTFGYLGYLKTKPQKAKD